jgi:flavorubredoxin
MTTATAPNFAAAKPINHHEPLKVAEDTYIIRQVFGEGQPMAVYANSLVILGRQPIIVDTGTVSNREDWLNDVFGLVDPKDVRWVFLSHDDHDHTGNLSEVLEMCPNATLVTTWFQLERLAGDYSFPMDRMRWVGDGEAFDAGDRLLAAIRPPIFDSPTTRGLYDSKSRVYWASDCFASPMQTPVENVAELDRAFWAEGFKTFASAVSPWHTMLDQAKYNRAIDRIADLDLNAVVSAHTPIVTGQRIKEGFELLRTMPSLPEARLPGQAELEAILAAMTAEVLPVAA